MNFRKAFIPLLPLVCLCLPAIAQEVPPPATLRYHAALLKSPHNEALFSKFYETWIDEQPIESLETFLIERAEARGGNHFAILANYQIRRGQDDNALATLSKASEALPDDHTLRMERAKILFRRLELEAARESMKPVLAGNDESLSIEAAKLIGKSYLRESDPQAAHQTWETLLKKYPGNEDILEDLVELTASARQFETALEYSERLIAVSTDPFKKALRQIRKGELLAQSAENDKAVALWSETLAKTGEGSWLEREIIAHIEKSYRRQDRVDQLTEKLAELAEANPRRFAIHRELAKLEAAAGNMDSAIGRFRVLLKRSPGDHALREEFIRMLMDGERFDDAAEVLEKMISLDPKNPELHLRMAAIRFSQDDSAATLTALEKALGLSPDDESFAIRVASLMQQYRLRKPGEELLRKLADSPTATSAPAEALAKEYARTNRKELALELLAKIAETAELETLLRVTTAISTLGEHEKTFQILSTREADFTKEPRLLAALVQSAIAAEKPAEAASQAITLVRNSKGLGAISDHIRLAVRLLTSADQIAQWQKKIAAQPTRSTAETCLLAALAAEINDQKVLTEIFEGAIDPTLIRFHASLLEQRNDFASALRELGKLADTPEGQKTSFFKELSELQIRAGQIDEALATLEKWKQASPSDQTPWTTAIRLLQTRYQLPEALATARKACAKFPKDTDLTATLAAILEQSRQFTEAENLYWRLYDLAESPKDQARWATQLSQLAMNSSGIPELQEKFHQRALSNRRSLGPILAQIELARATRDDVGRRELLLQALRLKPTEVDLRTQLATLEEQSGNLEQAIQILKEGILIDRSDKLRRTLAQMYIRQGHVLKGLRELRVISGKAANDPRAAETTALSLAQAHYFEEAAQYLRDSLPDGGDWRTRFLLARLLEHDGRETEAFPIYLSLLDATGEIPSISNVHNSSTYQTSSHPWQGSVQREQNTTQLLSRLINSVTQHRYQTQHSRRQNPFQNSSRLLPGSPEEVRIESKIYLAELAANDEQKLNQLRNGGFSDIEFIIDLQAGTSANRQVDYFALLKKHPDYPGLFEMAIAYAGSSLQKAENTDFLRELARTPKLHSSARLQISFLLVSLPGADKQDWKTLLERMHEQDDLFTDQQIAQRIINFDRQSDLNIPAEVREGFEQILRQTIAGVGAEDNPLTPFHLSIFSRLGEIKRWIDGMNTLVTSHQEKKSDNARVRPTSHSPWSSGFYTQFDLPRLNSLPFSSIPHHLLYPIVPGNHTALETNPSLISADLLLESLDQFKSPVVRAWIAIRAADSEAISKALAADVEEDEAADLFLLSLVHHIEQDQLLEACRLVSQKRNDWPSNKMLTTMLNTYLVSIVSQLNEKQHKEFSEDLQDALRLCQKELHPQLTLTLIEKARFFGLDELAEEIASSPKNPQNQNLSQNQNLNQNPSRSANSNPNFTLGPATFAPSRIRSASRTNPTHLSPEDRIKKFVIDKKTTAAAREVMAQIRLRMKQGNQISDYLHSLDRYLNPETRTEILRIAAPGESISLHKRLEFVEIAEAFEKTGEALRVLEELAAERPDDIDLITRLVLLLPPTESTRAIKLLTHAVASEEFITSFGQIIGQLGREREPEHGLAAFLLITEFLESASPDALESENLSWVGYHAHTFFRGNYTRYLPNLLTEQQGKANEKYAEAVALHTQIAKRLGFAMLRHPGCAEEGFQLLASSNAWNFSPEKTDELARQSLLAGKRNLFESSRKVDFFTQFSEATGNSRNSEIKGISSITWLAERLNENNSHGNVLPQEFLRELRKYNPETADILDALIGMKTPGDLSKAWDMLPTKSPDSTFDPFTQLHRAAIITRANTIPGSTEFFIARIQEIPPAENPQSHPSSNLAEHTELFSAAFATLAGAGDKEIRLVCKTVGEQVFGSKIEWDSTDRNYLQKVVSGSQFLYQVLFNTGLKSDACIKISRSLQQLDFPVNDIERWVINSFRETRFKNPEQAVKLMESMGLLNEIGTWKPLSVLSIRSTYEGNTMRIEPDHRLTFDQITREIISGLNRDKCIAFLLKKDTPTFGVLITAASLSYNNERQEIAKRAFEQAHSHFAKSKPAHLEEFLPLLDWLPRESYSSLHPFFQNELQKTDRQKLKEALARVKAYSDQQKTNNSPDYFYGLSGLLRQIVLIDPESAASAFLDAERKFTQAIKNGAAISPQGARASYRDSNLLESVSGSQKYSMQDVIGPFRLWNRVIKSEVGDRFSLSSSNDRGYPALYDIGYSIRRVLGNDRNSKTPIYLRMLVAANELPEDIRNEALIGCLIQEINNESRSEPGKHRADLANDKSLSKEVIFLSTLSSGIIGWKDDSPEGRLITTNILGEVLDDTKIHHTTRMQLAFASAIKSPEILNDWETAARIATLFELYCSAERSAANPFAITLVKSIAAIDSNPKNLPTLQRINTAFWKNTESVKSGGHLPIPSESISELFVASVVTKNKEQQDRLLPLIHTSAVGHFPTIVLLIRKGAFESASKLLPGDSEPYRDYNQNIPDPGFTSETFAAFSEASEDKVKALRFKCAALTHRSSSRSETNHLKVPALVSEFKNLVPKESPAYLEIIHTLIQIDPLVILEFGDELKIISQDLDYTKLVEALIRARALNQPTETLERQCTLLHKAAMVSLIDGNPGPLQKLCESIVTLANEKSEQHSSIIKSQHNLLISELYLGSFISIAQDEHQSLEKCFDSLMSLIDQRNQESVLSQLNFRNHLPLYQFLACWSDRTEDYFEMEDHMKNLPDNRKAHTHYPHLLSSFLVHLRNITRLESEEFLELRKAFFLKILSKKSMLPVFADDDYWLTNSRSYQYGLPDLIMNLEKPEAAKLPPEIRAIISARRETINLEYERDSQHAEGIRKKLEALSLEESSQGNEIRFRYLSFSLAEVLIRMDNFKEVEKIIQSVEFKTADEERRQAIIRRMNIRIRQLKNQNLFKED